MYSQHNDHYHSPIYSATIDMSPPRAAQRRIARDVVAKSRRLRQRVSVAAGLCVGLTTLLIAL